MYANFAVVAPVFLLIAAGYAASHAGAIRDDAVDAILGFVIRFAVPTLLFNSLYTLDLGRAFAPGMLAAFYAGAFVSFFAGVLFAWALGRRPGEQVAVGFCAFFSNTLLLGLPIMMRAYGEEATRPMLGVIALHAPLLYTFGMIAMEVARRDGLGAAAALKRASRNIVSNALMIGILLGLTCNLIGLPIPAAAADAVDLLASAALPTALFAVGAALTRYTLREDLRLGLGVSAISLLLHPAIAYGLAAGVFDLDDDLVRAAVVTAAMPAGMNVYIFAAMYHRAEGVAASALLISTALSVATISVWLGVLGGVSS